MKVKNLFENGHREDLQDFFPALAATPEDDQLVIENYKKTGVWIGVYHANGTGISSMRGAPKRVIAGKMRYPVSNVTSAGSFRVAGNRLKSLDFIPEEADIYVLSDNLFSDLKDIHKHIKSAKKIFLERNPLKSHILGLLYIQGLEKVKLKPDIVADAAEYVRWEELEDIINKHLKTRDILDCQEELIDAGFEEYAQL